MKIKLSIPPSPTWETPLNISIGELPKSFKWKALVNKILHYPNISLQSDSETMKEFQEEFSYATKTWNKPCRHPYPCPHGRQTLSKKQKNQKLGIIFGSSLCGICMLNHFVNEKRTEMEILSPEEISEWYFSDSNDEDMSDSEDEDIYDKMQLQRSPSGTLQFTENYLKILNTGVFTSSSA
jgi:hypothetical protein